MTTLGTDNLIKTGLGIFPPRVIPAVHIFSAAARGFERSRAAVLPLRIKTISVTPASRSTHAPF